MPFIQTIGPEDAEGELKEIYKQILSSRGKIAEVHKIQSLNPKTIQTHIDLYLSVMFSQSPLTRAEREMMAVVVSVENGCHYCQEHHGEALLSYWRDEERIKNLRANIETASLSAREIALCRYARLLTRSPVSAGNSAQGAEELRSAGLSDREILDATLVISYFNFVNRIVLALGVDLEDDAGGYKY